MKASLIQYCATSSVAINLSKLDTLLEQAQQQANDIIVLPENFAVLSGKNFVSAVKDNETIPAIMAWLSSRAKKHNVWILAGSMPAESGLSNKVYTRCLLVDPNGEIYGHYDKMHLFDADVADNVGQYRESDYIVPGTQLGLFDLPWGKAGVAICYDLRFPEYFRSLVQAGVKYVFVPAAFTYTTGEAHWLPLLRARAIENQIYILACNQTGTHDTDRQTWGHSSIIDPWGRVVAGLEAEEGVVSWELDIEYLESVRKQMPVLKHRRL
ncbi:carbon-nitrogen hydrolase family protein [Teredinibacter sp. KSP-S5-2]|uniref:carbon-nitrogen hydrolase family protein n=1 Tax=Teredinibacter sp. KSP-S5-2 TaxID=3034506 RepID=UPI0029343EE4|nr:carbon-nitrogen hydrolase family protein [Teredinibacter sp. KSP-S5-2]WNO11474.1 carbon-nitrogen hydrolase family protein [Teredinibacter sp. KSP-S5-2]